MSDNPQAAVTAAPDEFPVPVSVFVESLKGTPDEVYGILIANTFRYRKMRMAEWPTVIEGFRNAPAHPAAPV